MIDLRIREGLLLAVCALGFAGCVAETPAQEADAALSAGEDGGGGEGGGRYTVDAGLNPTADAGAPATCEVACRPTGVCPGTQICLLVGCCGEPTAPVVEHFAIGRGAGVLMVQATILDTSYDAETLVITVGDAVHTQPLQYTVAERTELKVPVFTESLAEEAQVYVRDREGRQSATVTVPVVDLPVRRPTAPCDPSGYESWCGPGGICLSTDDQATGLCYIASARTYIGEGESFWLDVRAGAPAEIEPAINAFTVDGQLVSPGYIQNPEGWRFLARFWAAEADAEVRYQAHLIGGRLSPQAPEPRRVDEACDPERIADRCAETTACKAGICTPISAPNLGSVNAVWRDGVLALTMSGDDAQADAHRFMVVTSNRTRMTVEGRFGDRLDVSGLPIESGANWAAQRFVAWLAVSLGDEAPESVSVVLVDDEGLQSAAMEVPVRLAEPGEVLDAFADGCDRSGLLGRCEGGQICDADGTDTSARCRTPRSLCPEQETIPLDRAPDGTAVLSALHIPGGIQDAPVSCVGAATGYTRFFSYEVPADGRYRFSLGDSWGGPFHLAVRPYCNLWQELACVARFDSRDDASTIELDLTRAQLLTVVVMATWSRSMDAPVTLRVDPVP